MATMAAAVSDIRTTSHGRDNLTAVAARSVPVTRSHPLPLPTPPNSISPALPPHGLKAQLQKARLEPIDSDLDLQDGRDAHHFSVAGNPAAGAASPPDDSTGAISPAMLAKYHLPEILLNHGPLAIRHIMGYLTTSVPGFAGIPPAKARRLVVGALEGRGNSGDGAGPDADVRFEKVGWGRWDARQRGQPSRDPAARRTPSSGGASPHYTTGIPISKSAPWTVGRPRMNASGSSVGESAAFSHDDHDIMMLETEADMMSMDGSASASCSEAPDDDVVMNDDPEDVTDDEDWAAMGAVALRAAASYSNSAAPQPRHSFFTSSVYNSGSGMRSLSASAGMARPPQPPGNFNLATLTLGGASASQEREAVEALLRLGSV